jgi:uncharacterized protein
LSALPKTSLDVAPIEALRPFWPNEAALDFDRLVASGWKPEPFSLFLCKIHSRCNLNCTYCYMYNLADQSWKQQPKLMTLPVVKCTAKRIREHVLAHKLNRIEVVMHGGEPLLAAAKYVRAFTDVMLSELSDVTDVSFGMQTNGTLLTPEIADLLVERKIMVGISLDGPQEVNDLHRIYHSGRSSHDRVIKGVELLTQPAYRSAFAGFLSVINLQGDPLEVLDHLLSFEPRGLDFLFPHGNWTNPPLGKNPPFTDAPYADWLIPIFDTWYAQRPKRVEIRLFSEIINLLLGGKSGFESIGLPAVNLVVIETNGQLEGVDSLKSTFEGATRFGMSVFSHSFDDALRHPNVMARQVGTMALHDTCLSCELHRVCGAGYYPHRYDARNGFRNPTVFCSDLIKLITHIYRRVSSDIARLKRGDAPALVTTTTASRITLTS